MTTSFLTNLSLAQFKKAINLKKKIEQLEGKLDQLVAMAAPLADAVVDVVSKTRKKKRTMSPAARAKISAAAKARWARQKSGDAVAPVAQKTSKKKRTMSAAAKAKISAAAKARWARFRAKKK